MWSAFVRLAVITLAVFVPSMVHAASDECMDIKSIMDKELPEFGGNYWFAHQLKRKGQVWLIIFSQTTAEEKLLASPKWKIMERQSEDRPDLYCGVANGQGTGRLMSLHDTKFDEKFGMPGSGYARCSNSGDPLGGMKVRAWASRELGDSVIVDFEGADGLAFILLFSKHGGYWVLLSQKPGEGTCYFDRGEEHDFRRVVLSPE